MTAFDSQLDEAIHSGILPGAVLFATNKSGSLQYSRAVSGPNATYTKDTVLEIASLTKLLTTIAALQLVEQNRLHLDQNVEFLLPEFARLQVLDGFSADGEPILHKRRNPVTLRSLLTHSAGASYAFLDPRVDRFQEWQKAHDNPKKTLEKPENEGTINAMFAHPLSCEPGEDWFYSSSMDRVGQLVERVTGQGLETYMQKSIWKPLGITTASFSGPAQTPMAKRAKRGQPAIPDPGMKTYTTGLTECSGGQGLFMSMRDYAKILHSLLVDDGVLLRSETTAWMFQPQLSPSSRSGLQKRLAQPGWVVGDIPPTDDYDWGLGGLLVDGNKHPFRCRYMLSWSGAPSLYWFIDREAGVCGVFGTQILPPADTECYRY